MACEALLEFFDAESSVYWKIKLNSKEEFDLLAGELSVYNERAEEVNPSSEYSHFLLWSI